MKKLKLTRKSSNHDWQKEQGPNQFSWICKKALNRTLGYVPAEIKEIVLQIYVKEPKKQGDPVWYYPVRFKIANTLDTVLWYSNAKTGPVTGRLMDYTFGRWLHRTFHFKGKEIKTLWVGVYWME